MIENDWSKINIIYGDLIGNKIPPYKKSIVIYDQLMGQTKKAFLCSNKFCSKVLFNGFGNCECGSPIKNSAVFFDVIPLIKAIFADPLARKYLKYHLSKSKNQQTTDITESNRFFEKKLLFGNRLTDIFFGLNQDG